MPGLPPAVGVVDHEIDHTRTALHIAVVHDDGRADGLAQCGIVSLTEAHQNQPFHPPHRRKRRDLLQCPGGFNHQEEALFVCLAGECVQRRRDEAVLQDFALVLGAVIDDHADDAGAFLRQPDARWAVRGDILDVLPWMTLDTVAVLSPSLSAISTMRIRFSCMVRPLSVLPLYSALPLYGRGRPRAKVKRITTHRKFPLILVKPPAPGILYRL